MIILSILIPTIPERGEMFTKLFNEVHRQVSYMDTFHPTLGQIEVLVDDSKRFIDGGLSIGKKREALVQRATGKYLCFLDDDESIAPNYVEVLVRMCNEGMDLCTFRSLVKLDNFWCMVDMSLWFGGNTQVNPNDYTIQRRPWHICPIRSEYAKETPFPDISYGEDWAWMENVLKRCTTQSHSYCIIHQYNHSSRHSEADKIINHVFTESGGNSYP